MKGASSEEMRRLLAAGRPRPRTASERARSAAFVARLGEKPAPSRFGFEVFRWLPAAALVLGALLGLSGDRPDLEPSVQPIVAEVMPRRILLPEAASYGSSSAGVLAREGEGTPGEGDACGALICASRPSCCERAWDEDCDELLLRHTLSYGGPRSSMRCYWHDRADCPNCACPVYLKRFEDEERTTQRGFDGGSGCIRQDARARLLSELKWMCVQGYCDG